LGETQVVADLCSLMRRNSRKIIFLSETKRCGAKMDIVRRKLGNFFAVYVDSHGRAGGLALLWEKMVKLILCSFSTHHMDASICWEGDTEEWRFTGVYGWSETHNKFKTGHLITDLSSHSQLQWVVGGDLNEIFYHSGNVAALQNRSFTLIHFVMPLLTMVSMIWDSKATTTHRADGITGRLWWKNA